MPVGAGDRQDEGCLWRRRGQAPPAAEQPGGAAGGHQDGKAADVRVIYRRQVDDQSAGGATEHGVKRLAQRGSSRDVKFAAERGDGEAVLGPGGKTEARTPLAAGV
jgi:hypothetical protein